MSFGLVWHRRLLDEIFFARIKGGSLSRLVPLSPWYTDATRRLVSVRKFARQAGMNQRPHLSSSG
jgi:hypothetical protein